MIGGLVLMIDPEEFLQEGTLASHRLKAGNLDELRGSIPLAEIGARTGFKDQSYFTRMFKCSTGMSPGK